MNRGRPEATQIPQPADVEILGRGSITREQVVVEGEKVVIKQPMGGYKEGDRVRITPRDSESG